MSTTRAVDSRTFIEGVAFGRAGNGLDVSERRKRWVLAVVLVAALVFMIVGWWVADLGAALCESDRPGRCEDEGTTADVMRWLVTALGIAALVAVVRAARTRSD